MKVRSKKEVYNDVAGEQNYYSKYYLIGERMEKNQSQI